MAKKIKIHNSASGYNLASVKYDQKGAYLNSFEKGHIFELLGDIRNKKILDVGAGTGRLAIPLAKLGAKVTALDVAAEMLERLREKAQIKTEIEVENTVRNLSDSIETIVGDAEALPFPGQTFDIVVAAFLIVHLKDPRRFFDEAYRVLKSGGWLLVTNINQKAPPGIVTRDGEIKIQSYYHRREQVRDILEDLAFSIKKEIFVKDGEVWINQIIVVQS